MLARRFPRTACAHHPNRVRPRHFIPLVGFLLPTIVIGYAVVLPRNNVCGVNELTVGFGSTIVGAAVTYIAGVLFALRREVVAEVRECRHLARPVGAGASTLRAMGDEDIDLSSLKRIGRGRAAEVFELDDARVIKVARDGAGASLDREAAAMRAAHAAKMPVPAPHGLVEVSGRRGLIMGRARGVDMLTQFARRPWTIIRAGAKLGRLHATLHETIAPSELPSLKATLHDRIAASPHVPESARERVLGVLRDLPDGDRLCHLDFHPANVIADGASMIVIDWPGACRGDPLADVAMTTITLQGGKTTPGTPLITRLLAPIGRKLLLGGYRRGYRKHGRFDRERFARWVVVAAAQRLTYGIAGEDAALLRLIDRGTR